MMPKPLVPTGPIHSFQSLIYPLPDDCQSTLRAFAQRIADARADHLESIKGKNQDRFDCTQAHILDADRDMGIYTDGLRASIGAEHVRREFLPVLR